MDVTTVTIALMTLVILVKFKKVQEPLLIAAAGSVGLVLKGL